MNGSIEPAANRPSRRSISFFMFSAVGMAVYQSFHSSPSFTASTSPLDVIVRQRLQPRVRALKGNRFKKGHSVHSSPICIAHVAVIAEDARSGNLEA